MLYTKDGSRVLGRHSSKQKAIKQEYAIQKSQEKNASFLPTAGLHGLAGGLLYPAIGFAEGKRDRRKLALKALRGLLTGVGVGAGAYGLKHGWEAWNKLNKQADSRLREAKQTTITI